jgi:transposase
MAKTLNVKQFFEMFPTDDACLDHLMNTRFGVRFECPKCQKTGNWHKLAKVPAYACQWCGNHIHPMKGTPFEASHTPLQKWFYAMYLFTTSRHGVPAKELQRQLSVTYKTAWRMGHEIRKYMAKVDGDDQLSGTIESDETYIGGEVRGEGQGPKMRNKTVVMGMVQRDGKVMTKVVPNARKATLLPIVEANIVKGSTVYTDELKAHRSLTKMGYTHDTVEHGRDEYVRGVVHTNTIEGYWSRFKNSIRGTHVHVSKKHMQSYLGEFEFRFNLRKSPSSMFDALLAGFCT